MWLRVAIAVGAMLLASCASTPKGSAEAEIAAGLAGQQRYRDAIAAIDQAIAKEPRNTSYQQTRTRYLSDLNTLVKQKVDQALRGTTTEAELDAADAMIKGMARLRAGTHDSLSHPQNHPPTPKGLIKLAVEN